VADGGSGDGTRDIVRELSGTWPNLRLLDNPRRLSSAGRNVGAAAARGRYVMFLDGHCALPRDDYLVRVVEIFESSGADCLARPQPLDQLQDGAWSEAFSTARHSRLGHHPGSDIYGGEPGFTEPHHAGAAYVRDRFEELGGYDERFDACEDVELNHRVAEAGLRSYRHPDLTVHYRPRSDPGGLYRQMLRYGRGRARLMIRHPRIVPWQILAVVCLGLLGPATLLVIAPVLAAGWLGILALTWVSIVLVASIRVAGFGTKALRVVLAFGAIHAGLVLGFCRGLPEFARYRRPPRAAIREHPSEG